MEIHFSVNLPHVYTTCPYNIMVMIFSSSPLYRNSFGAEGGVEKVGMTFVLD